MSEVMSEQLMLMFGLGMGTGVVMALVILYKADMRIKQLEGQIRVFKKVLEELGGE